MKVGGNKWYEMSNVHLSHQTEFCEEGPGLCCPLYLQQLMKGIVYVDNECDA